MLGCVNKTDPLDVHGLNRLQRTGRFPTVWVPPGEVRDQRELTRTRRCLVRQRTRRKCRIEANLSKDGLNLKKFSDPFGKAAREEMDRAVAQLPPCARGMRKELLRPYEFVSAQVDEVEQWMERRIEVTPAMQRWMTLPGVGRVVSVVIALGVGDVRRFASARHLASYAGGTRRVHSSGDRTR